ncbi:MAG: DJ-1 family glyoxalase III [Planctomycetota bacterium]|nr:DJ-1 family glyoxalase III [Planctomycetota bacterium]
MATTVSMTESSLMRVLLPVATGNEDIEFCALRDVLCRAELDVTVASVEGLREVVLMKGLRIIPDAGIEDAVNQSWDAIAMAGGIPGAMNLAKSETLRTLLQSQHAKKGVIGAICLSPALVLESAGVLANSKRATCNPLPIKTPDQSWPADEFTKLLGDKFDRDARVCVDEENRIVTSQTPGTAIEYALALVTMLRGPEVAQRISEYFLVR